MAESSGTSVVKITHGVPFSRATIDDVEYVMVNDVTEAYSGANGYELRFEGFRVVNQCDHCHRFDTEPNVAHSWQEAIDNGWLVRADDPRVAHLLTR